MTGYTFAAFLFHKTKMIDDQPVLAKEMEDENVINKIYLVCKDFPLLIKKSAFSKHSFCHVEKYDKFIAGNNH